LSFVVCLAKSGRATADAGTVGGPCPYMIARSNSFITHSHVLAKKNSAITANECSTYSRLSIVLCWAWPHVVWCILAGPILHSDKAAMSYA